DIFAINYAIGLLSAVVDNVPLVAGAMKMYPLVSEGMLASTPAAEAEWMSRFVVDGRFWQLLAFCAGTGGSSLIIGSAAGVAAMLVLAPAVGLYHQQRWTRQSVCP